jgi:hypothetical protein
MVYFPVVIPMLSLAFEVCAGTPGNGEDCPMGWECFVLQLEFLDLRRRWRWRVVFNLNLGIDILLWIGDLGLLWGMFFAELVGVCYLQNLRGVVSDLVWHSDRTSNMPKVELDWPSKFVEKGKGMMWSIADGGSIGWCG